MTGARPTPAPNIIVEGEESEETEYGHFTKEERKGERVCGLLLLLLTRLFGAILAATIGLQNCIAHGCLLDNMVNQKYTNAYNMFSFVNTTMSYASIDFTVQYNDIYQNMIYWIDGSTTALINNVFENNNIYPSTSDNHANFTNCLSINENRINLTSMYLLTDHAN